MRISLSESLLARRAEISPNTHDAQMINRLAVLPVSLTPFLAACTLRGHAPSFVVFGSYFPAWIVCGIFGVIAAIVVRALFIRAGIDEGLQPRLLVYLSLCVLCSLLIWLTAFAGAV